MAFDVQHIREDFPLLHQKIDGKPLVYLDNGATTQKPQCVIDKLMDFYQRYNANAHRGVYYLANVATQAYENARTIVQQFINAKHNHEIIFTKGTSESINLIAYVFTHTFVTEGDEIIVSEMEHHSNFVPWQLACTRKKATLKVLPFDDSGKLEIEKLSTLINKRTKIIAITHVSNVLGTQNPIKKIVKLAHRHDIPVLVDAAQSVVHTKVDVQDLDCDFLAFSGHKLYAPAGIGVLYGKEKWLKTFPPWQSGGEMIASVTIEKSTFNALPYKFEAGTPNIGGAIALAEAIRYLDKIDWNHIISYEHQLAEYAHKQLIAIKGITIYGNNPNSSLLSFNIKGIHHYDLGLMLDKMGIAVRTGQLCAEIVMQHYGVDGMVRASFSFYNTFSEIDYLCESITKLAKIFT